MKTRKFIYKDMGISPKNSCEMAFPDDMLAIFHLKHGCHTIQSVEQRKRICNVFGLMIKLANKYLPPKQRKVFYSVWVRSGGKVKEGVMEYSRKTGQNYITNYTNYYKSLKNMKTLMGKLGFDKFIQEYIEEGALIYEEHDELL